MLVGPDGASMTFGSRRPRGAGRLGGMSDTMDLAAVTDWLAERRRPLVISHDRPDGDALGSISAMTLGLTRLGQRPLATLYNAFPRRYGFLEGPHPWYHWDEIRGNVEDDVDAVVIVDTCALAQLQPIAGWLSGGPPILVLDHHATRDPVGSRDEDLRYFDETAGAAALIVHDWLARSRVEIDPQIAAALFTGIATDTGWFRFSNADERIFRAASDLVAAGVSSSAIHAALHDREPVEKLRLVAHLLGKLELHADGRLVVMTLREADFAATGADRTMTEDLVNEGTRLGGTEVTLLITEEPDNLVRVNLRSKHAFDVAEFARRYGGGGHPRAAGLRVRGEWDQVVPRLIDEIADAL